jgi:hypothetical protein
MRRLAWFLVKFAGAIVGLVLMAPSRALATVHVVAHATPSLSVLFNAISAHAGRGVRGLMLAMPIAVLLATPLGKAADSAYGPSAHNSTASTNALTIKNDGSQQATLTVNVKGIKSAAIAGDVPTATFTGTGTLGAFSAADANGVSTASFTTTDASAHVFTFKVRSVTLEATVTVTGTVSGGLGDATSTLVGSTTRVVIGTGGGAVIATFTVTAKAAGVAIGASGGPVVIASVTGTNSGSWALSSVVDNGDGTYTFTFTALTLGSADRSALTVSASINGIHMTGQGADPTVAMCDTPDVTPNNGTAGNSFEGASDAAADGPFINAGNQAFIENTPWDRYADAYIGAQCVRQVYSQTGFQVTDVSVASPAVFHAPGACASWGATKSVNVAAIVGGTFNVSPNQAGTGTKIDADHFTFVTSGGTAVSCTVAPTPNNGAVGYNTGTEFYYKRAAAVTEDFERFAYKQSNPFNAPTSGPQSGTSNVDEVKLARRHAIGNGVTRCSWLLGNSYNSNPGGIIFRFDTVDPSHNLGPNVNLPAPNMNSLLGTWVVFESHVKDNGDGTTDFEGWINGVLYFDYTKASGTQRNISVGSWQFHQYRGTTNSVNDGTSSDQFDMIGIGSKPMGMAA